MCVTYVWDETLREMREKNKVSDTVDLYCGERNSQRPFFLILVELVSASLMTAKVFSIVLLLLSYLEPSTAFLQYTLPADLQLFDIISPKQAF